MADAFEAFYQGPAQVIGQAFSQIIEWVKGLIAVFTETFTTAAGFDGLGNTISTLGGIVSSVWHGVLEPLANLLINIAKVIIPPLVQIIGGTLGTAFNIIGGIISNVIQGIQNFIQAIKNIIEAVKTTVRKIKETIKLPHFSISGSLSIAPPSVPRLSISWYKEGGIRDGPTIFGMNGSSLMAGGEAGPEAILPLKGFYTQLAQMLDERLNMAGMERYLAIIADNSSKGIYLEDGTLVGHLLPAIDSGLAKYSMRGGRGNR